MDPLGLTHLTPPELLPWTKLPTFFGSGPDDYPLFPLFRGKFLPIGGVISLLLNPVVWLCSLIVLGASFITLSISWVARANSWTEWNYIATKINFSSCLSPSRNRSTRWCSVGRWLVGKIDESWNLLSYFRTVIFPYFKSRNSCSFSLRCFHEYYCSSNSSRKFTHLNSSPTLLSLMVSHQ